MRNTIQNELILKIVENSCEHYTAEEIYKRCLETKSNISLGTIYRNLNRLVDMKKIRRIKMPDNVDRYDNNIIHAHTVCIICNNINDIKEKFIKKTPVIDNFVVNDYDLIFYGVCKKCLEKDSKNGIKRK